MNLNVTDSLETSLPSTISNDEREHILQAAKFLREQGAKRVWLFGSFAKGRLPSVHSDYDFAVEGLPGDRLFGTIGHLLQTLPRRVDVIELDDCPAFLRQQITEHGISLA